MLRQRPACRRHVRLPGDRCLERSPRWPRARRSQSGPLEPRTSPRSSTLTTPGSQSASRPSRPNRAPSRTSPVGSTTGNRSSSPSTPDESSGGCEREPIQTAAFTRASGSTPSTSHPDGRGRGIGRLLLVELCAESERHGLYKLTSRVFTDNEPSLAAHRSAGFEEVGIQRRHGKLDAQWKDCVLVERLLAGAAG